MAEPLKNSFGPDVVAGLADDLARAWPAFDRARFTSSCLKGFDELELTGRARHISDQLAQVLPDDRGNALRIIVAALGPELDSSELEGMSGFRYLPYVYFVADYGIDHFSEAMELQYEVTKRFTAEFSLRTFIDAHYDATMAQLHEWVRDNNVHVRRLVSEGTRSRLPWAARIKRFQADASPVIELLEQLKDDPEEYVRRSVANNLNDIAKDDPELVVQTVTAWWPTTVTNDAEHHRRRLIKHALRTLIKQGHEGALDVLGYGPDSPITVDVVRVEPATVPIGSKVRIEVDLTNPSDAGGAAMVDLVVHFVKANGSTSAKVFKGAEVEIEPGASATVGKNISVKQHSTRTHHSGTHRVEVMVNGATHPGGSFELTD